MFANLLVAWFLYVCSTVKSVLTTPTPLHEIMHGFRRINLMGFWVDQVFKARFELKQGEVIKTKFWTLHWLKESHYPALMIKKI